MSATVEEATAVKGRLPRQIAFIIGNEGCERFSFYGMRNILTGFLVSTLLLGFGVMAFQMFFFAGFAFLAAIAFGFVARRCKSVDHYRTG